MKCVYPALPVKVVTLAVIGPEQPALPRVVPSSSVTSQTGAHRIILIVEGAQETRWTPNIVVGVMVVMVLVGSHKDQGIWACFPNVDLRIRLSFFIDYFQTRDLPRTNLQPRRSAPPAAVQVFQNPAIFFQRDLLACVS